MAINVLAFEDTNSFQEMLVLSLSSLPFGALCSRLCSLKTFAVRKLYVLLLSEGFERHLHVCIRFQYPKH